LFYIGNIEALSQNICAVIGARQPSENGHLLTESFVDRLNENSIACLSGGALGHDIIAHKHWLKTYDPALPKPIVVLPRLDALYPAKHAAMYKQILDKGGLLISQNLECRDDLLVPALIARDYVQALLSDVVAPMEMGTESGTWHCINAAYKLNKPILALDTKLTSKGVDCLLRFPTEDCKGFLKEATKRGEEWNKNIHTVNKFNLVSKFKSLFTT
jgi:DNA processing protein